MIRKLQIIFGLDTVAGQLGVARHALIFLEQLRRITTLPIILAIAAIIIAGHAPGLLSTAAATAAALTIIDQSEFPRRTGAMAPQNHSLEGSSLHPPAVRRARSRLDPCLAVCARSLRSARPISSGVGSGSALRLFGSGPVPVSRCSAFTRIIQAFSIQASNQQRARPARQIVRQANVMPRCLE